MDTVRPLLTGPTNTLLMFRDSDTTMRILIPAIPTYDIFAPDIINIYIPPEAVFSNQLIVAPTQIRIEATKGLLSITGGTLVTDNAEAALQRV